MGDIYSDVALTFDNIIRYQTKFNEFTSDHNCYDCVATTCLKCNVAKFKTSTLEKNMDKWYDFKNNNMFCFLYQQIGIVHRALLKIME